MGRIYTSQFNGVASTLQQDLFELVAPADGIVVIHEINISQLSDVGDAQEEMLLILLKSGQTTSGSGGTTPSAVPLLLGDAAFGGTVEANNTTKASLGTIVTHAAWDWNIRMPFQIIYTPETRPVLSPSRRATVELATTPADSVTLSGTITFEEVG
ncbi:MAG: hypothetical protein ACE5IR_27140 [bacterium]